MKTLLVLAASEHQVGVIEAAKRLGVRVLTTDNRPNNPGHKLAHVSFGVDTTDADAVQELARAQAIDGIISACTDVAVPTAAHVGEQLGLPGIPLAAAYTCTDKLLFRRFLDAAGLPNPSWAEVGDGHPEPTDLLQGGPCVLKPATSSGSKGIFVVDGVEDFRARLPATMAFCRDGRAIIELFLDGKQGTVEGILRGGRIAWGMVTQRQTAPLPYTATWGHVVPSGLATSMIEGLRDVTERLFEALGIHDGPFDCDFVIADGIAHVLEMSPRLGGNALSELARVSAGIDLPHYAVQQALGRPFEVQATEISPAAAVLLGAESAGVLAYDTEAAAQFAALPWVHSVKLDRQPGERVEPFINGRHRVAALLITASDPEELRTRSAQLKVRLNIHTT